MLFTFGAAGMGEKGYDALIVLKGHAVRQRCEVRMHGSFSFAPNQNSAVLRQVLMDGLPQGKIKLMGTAFAVQGSRPGWKNRRGEALAY